MTVPWPENTFAEYRVKWLLLLYQEAGVSGICDKPFEPDTVKTYLQKIMADL